ncbi:YbaB/EbfC family nucleoid-associated protein [Gemmatimonas aurantiaca]|nr:YbaB/EbfC family nucleoid-associated protein [Gemmatimonas aurantiaca]
MGLGDIGGMLKQMQQMQGKVAEMQAEMEKLEVEGSSGGGMVNVVCNGKNEVKSITIDPEVVNPEDIEMLQDLIIAAINQAREKVSQSQSSKMSELTGGLNIPGLTLPF